MVIDRSLWAQIVLGTFPWTFVHTPAANGV
jgi:hypothetical protein